MTLSSKRPGNVCSPLFSFPVQLCGVRLWWRIELHPFNDRVPNQVTFIYEKFFASGANERYLTRLDARAFFPGELRMLFQVSGFDIENIYGGYAWQPFERGTRQIIIGCKPGAQRSGNGFSEGA